MSSPLHQFEVKTLIPLKVAGYDFSFTNVSLFMVLTVGLIGAFFILALKNKRVLPKPLQASAELFLDFLNTLVKENIGPAGTAYLPLIFSIFSFILVGNLLGLLPYAYTFTSQLILTFVLALVIFVLITVLGFVKHGTKFFSYFLPAGTPLVLAPLLVTIEVISYFSRPVSLAIRLFANMMAGHTMLKVFAAFTVSLGIFGFSSVLTNVVLIGFEVMVAFLQAYVFSVLGALYIKDAIHLH